MYCRKIVAHFTLYNHIINSRISVISFMSVTLLLLLLRSVNQMTLLSPNLF